MSRNKVEVSAYEPLLLDQHDIDETAVDVMQAFDETWRKVIEAQDLLRYAQRLIENTTLKHAIGRVVKELKVMQFDYVRLVQKWDDVPELRKVRLAIEAEKKQDTEAARPIAQGDENG